MKKNLISFNDPIMKVGQEIIYSVGIFTHIDRQIYLKKINDKGRIFALNEINTHWVKPNITIESNFVVIKVGKFF